MSILEPSAGKGDLDKMLQFLSLKNSSIDCIEKDTKFKAS